MGRVVTELKINGKVVSVEDVVSGLVSIFNAGALDLRLVENINGFNIYRASNSNRGKLYILYVFYGEPVVSNANYIPMFRFFRTPIYATPFTSISDLRVFLKDYVL